MYNTINIHVDIKVTLTLITFVMKQKLINSCSFYDNYL